MAYRFLGMCSCVLNLIIQLEQYGNDLVLRKVKLGKKRKKNKKILQLTEVFKMYKFVEFPDLFSTVGATT